MRICSRKLLIFETQYCKFNFLKNQAYLKHVCIHPLTVRLTSDQLWEIENVLFCSWDYQMLICMALVSYIHIITLVT